MKKTVGVFLLAVLLVVPGWVSAQDKQQGDESIATMEEVVVTATRTETTLDKIGGNSVTVITAEEIEAKKQSSVQAILKSVPGLDITSNGGPGTNTTVFMRGADSKNTLILIDGIMINDPAQANRGANLANITVDNVERIEVVRGAMSVMYGSNATAGVINIITKKGKKEPSFNVGAEGGSYDTWKAYGGALGATEQFNYSISASYTDTGGYSIADNDNDNIPHDGNTDEDDGYENLTLSGQLGFDITKDFNITGIVRYIDSEADLDDYGSGYTGDNIGSEWNEEPPGSGNWVETATPFPDGPTKRRTEAEQTFAKIFIDNNFFKKFLESRLSYQKSRQDRQSYDNNGAESYDYKSDVDEYAWQGSLNFTAHTLSFGANYFVEEMESTSSSLPEKDANTKSYWIQDQLFAINDLVVVAGARLDDHEEFGNKVTYRLAPSYIIEKTGTTVKASYGTGFRSPSLYELYSSYGNPDLEAEESTGWDIGFEQGILKNKINFGLTYFDMKFKDRIDYDFVTNQYDQLPGKTKTRGVESFVGWAPLSDLKFMFNYTYTDTEDPDGKSLARRPHNKIFLNTIYCFSKKGKLNLDIYWVDDRKASEYAQDGNGNPVDKLDAYSLVNLAANYDLTNYLQIYGRIDNLFDKYYEESWSYATPGLSGYVGIKVTY